MRIGRANEIGVTCADLFHEKFKIAIHAVGIRLWIETIFSGLGGDFITVLICSYLETYIMTILLLVTSPDVGEKIIK
ncbi:hypothetical protein D3C85_1653550 [compost metagenome]